ncbi:hypothetical protein TNCV_1156211 [Trichonephila clavipes]|nr:hypothetical protein TNCV_1156211 [Trichonephila clavipes]
MPPERREDLRAHVLCHAVLDHNDTISVMLEGWYCGSWFSLFVNMFKRSDSRLKSKENTCSVLSRPKLMLDALCQTGLPVTRVSEMQTKLNTYYPPIASRSIKSCSGYSGVRWLGHPVTGLLSAGLSTVHLGGRPGARISWKPDFLALNFDPLVPKGPVDLLPPGPEMSLNRLWVF